MENNLNSLTICKSATYPPRRIIFGKKRIKYTGLFKVLFLLLFIVGTNNLANAQKFKVGDLYYEITSTSPNEVKVVYQKDGFPYWNDNEKPIGDQIIPENVEYENKTYTVTEIDGSAFYKCTDLTSVTIPNTITIIGAYTFSECTSLTSITIPNSVTTIGRGAFSNCSGLTSVTIPNSVTTIGYNDAFWLCSNLTEINVEEDNPNYSSLDGVLFNKEKTLLILYPINKPDTEYEIPNTVTTIQRDGFSDCKNLVTLTIPNSVTTIREINFMNCIKLTTINVEENNSNYSSLDGVLFNKEKTSLISYPTNKLTTEYEIPNSITTIKEYAFWNCEKLVTVTIPNSVTTIEEGNFWRCLSLTDINVEENNSNFNSLDGVLFNKEKTSLIVYPAAKPATGYEIPNFVTEIKNHAFSNSKNLVTVTIPNSVTIIGVFAFYYCPILTSVIIPNSVTTIDKYAFSHCTILTSVTIPNSVTTINDFAFDACTSLISIISKIENISAVEMGYKVFKGVNKETCTLYVPKGKIDEYKAAEQWQDFINIEENTTIGVEIIKANNISIYPTCVQTGFTVEGSEPHKSLEIFTITGKKVLSTVIISNSQYIDVNNLQSGVYLVKIGNKTTKIIKM